MKNPTFYCNLCHKEIKNFSIYKDEKNHYIVKVYCHKTTERFFLTHEEIDGQHKLHRAGTIIITPAKVHPSYT